MCVRAFVCECERTLSHSIKAAVGQTVAGGWGGGGGGVALLVNTLALHRDSSSSFRGGPH